MFKNLKDDNSPYHESLIRVMMFLAICHTIVIDEKMGED
jgi:hypothetical protein